MKEQKSLYRFHWMTGSEENDWKEDFEYENGMYQHKCSCGADFIGHKRRRTCRVCQMAFVEKYNALSEEEKIEFLKSQKEKIDKFWEILEFNH